MGSMDLTDLPPETDHGTIARTVGPNSHRIPSGIGQQPLSVWGPDPDGLEREFMTFARGSEHRGSQKKHPKTIGFNT